MEVAGAVTTLVDFSQLTCSQGEISTNLYFIKKSPTINVMGQNLLFLTVFNRFPLLVTRYTYPTIHNTSGLPGIR